MYGFLDYFVDNTIIDINGNKYIYMGKANTFRIEVHRTDVPNTKNIRTNMVGEDENYFMQLNLDNSYIYIPIVSKEDFNYAQSFDTLAMGIAMLINKHIKAEDNNWLFSIGKPQKIGVQRIIPASHYKCKVNVLGEPNLDKFNSEYNYKELRPVRYFWYFDRLYGGDYGEIHDKYTDKSGNTVTIPRCILWE